MNGDWNVNTDEYLQLEMSTLYTEDPAYANVTVPVYTIQKPRSDKENMVIVYCAEGYTKSQQKQFVEDVKKLWGEVLQIEPYRSMADRFNVYALCTASVDGYGGTSTFFAATAKGGISTNKGNWRNHVLERIIGPAFIEKIHDAHIPNETHPNENTMDHNYRQYDYVYENINQFVVLANSGEYFGGSHDNKQYGIHYIVASARNAYSAFTQRHELGHGLFHLGDEYNYSTVPVDEWNYTTSLNMTATKDPTKVKWRQLLGFRNTYTCPHLDYYPYTYNSSRDCLMRETFQNDFCDVCKLQGIKVMSQLITNPPALYVAVPEVKKYIGGYRNPTKDPSAFEAANSSAYASYQNDRNSRLLSGGSKNSFDYSSMKGQQVELRTIIQNLSNTQAKTVTLRLWVEHSNGEKAVTTDGEQVFTTQEFDIPVWKEKSKFWTKGALDYEGSDFNSGLVNCSLVYTIPENAILQSGDTIGFEIVDHATGEVLADDDTEQQRYVNVTIQYQLEDGTDVPNTMPTTFTVPVGKKVDWQPPQELHGYTFVKAEGMENAVPNSGMTIRYIYKRSEERPEPPVTKNYTVQYNWGSVFPTDATLPLNSSYMENWSLGEKEAVAALLVQYDLPEDSAAWEDALQESVARRREAALDALFIEHYAVTSGGRRNISLHSIMQQELGELDPEWSLEQKAAYSALESEFELGGADEDVNLLPGEDDIPREEAVKIAKDAIQAAFGFTDEQMENAALWELSFLVHRSELGVKPPYYSVCFAICDEANVWKAEYAAISGAGEVLTSADGYIGVESPQEAAAALHTIAYYQSDAFDQDRARELARHGQTITAIEPQIVTWENQRIDELLTLQNGTVLAAGREMAENNRDTRRVFAACINEDGETIWRAPLDAQENEQCSVTGAMQLEDGFS